jgi:hypothetical protein
MTTDEKLVNSLPDWLRIQFPAVLSKRSGMDRQLMSLIVSAFDSGFGPSRISSMLKERYHEEHHSRMLVYISFCESRHEKVERFSSFNDPLGYAGHVPSGRYISHLGYV